MKLKVVQENLRKVLWKRIDAGEFTGTKLADQTGFKQAHISNFLNRKRQLSIAGFDKILAVQKLSVLDLLDPNEVSKRATIFPPSDDEFENVAVVEPQIAAEEPLVQAMNVKDVLKFKKAFLERLQAESERSRADWQRFVLLKVDAHEGMSMYPRLLPGSTVLLDRHYNSLKPYREGERNMYAVRAGGGCVIKYVELLGHNLVLRPHNEAYPISVVPIEEGKRYVDYIVGRVCHVANET
jgi:peptidase S24-like protein